METTKTGGLGMLALIAARNVRRNGRRTALCVFAVGTAVFFNIAMQSMIDGMMDGIEDVVRTFETGHVNAVSERFEADKEYLPVQFPVADGRPADALVAELEALPGVEAVLPRITAFASLFDSTAKHAVLWGVDVERERRANAWNLTDRDDGLERGRWPAAGSNECAVGLAFAKKAGLSIGDRIPLKTVSAQFSDKYWSPTVVGLFEFDYRVYDEDAILVPLDRLSRILVMEGSAQKLYVYADDERSVPAVRAAVARALGPGNVVRAWTDNYWIALMEQSSLMFVVVLLVFQIVAAFLIVNTVLMVIHERIKEIGMMGALGLTRREIVLVFFLESVALSVLGSLAGVLAGGAATLVGSRFPIDMTALMGGGMKEMPVAGTIFLVFSPSILAGSFAFGVLVSACCTVVPSLKSAFVEPVEALRR